MAGSVANLAVSVTARVNKFIAGFKRAQKTVRAFAATVGRVARRVTMLGTAMVAIGTAVAAMKLRKAFKELDLLAKTADQLGIVPERLQEMTLAANLAGATFEDLAKGMIYLQRRTAEVASGYGEAQTAFEMLRLDAQKMIQMAPEKQWAAFAEGLRGVTNQTKAMRATMDVLGRSGAKLMNLLRMSSDEMARVADWMKRSGLLLSREQLRLIEQANDAVTQMVLVLRLIWAQVAIRVAPAIKILAGRFNDAATEGKIFGKTLTAVLDGIARAAQATVEAILGIPRSLMTGKLALLYAGQAGVQKLPFLSSFFYGDKSKAQVLAEYDQSIADTIERMGHLAEAGRKIATDIRTAWKSALGGMGADVDVLAESFDTVAMTLRMKLGEEIDSILTKLRRMAQTAGKTAGEIALLDLYIRGATDAEMAFAKSLIEMTRIKKRDQALAKTAAATGGIAMPGGMTRFADVSLSRQAVMGANIRGLGGQLVRDPQLQETNRLLTQVADNTRSNTAFVVP